MSYHFPEITVNKNSLLAQVAKVIEEGGECVGEIVQHMENPLFVEPVERMCEEAWDILQAAETLVRQLKKKYPVHMAGMKFKVIEKCTERGYYVREQG